jgi:hypothetical protein
MSIIASSSASRTGLSAMGSGFSEQHDLHALGHRGEDRGHDVALGLHAERRVMVLVEHNPVVARLLGELIFDNAVLVELAARDRIEILVWENQRGVPELLTFLCGIGRHRLFGEVH